MSNELKPKNKWTELWELYMNVYQNSSKQRSGEANEINILRMMGTLFFMNNGSLWVRQTCCFFLVLIGVFPLTQRAEATLTEPMCYSEVLIRTSPERVEVWREKKRLGLTPFMFRAQYEKPCRKKISLEFRHERHQKKAFDVTLKDGREVHVVKLQPASSSSNEGLIKRSKVEKKHIESSFSSKYQTKKRKGTYGKRIARARSKRFFVKHENTIVLYAEGNNQRSRRKEASSTSKKRIRRRAVRKKRKTCRRKSCTYRTSRFPVRRLPRTRRSTRVTIQSYPKRVDLFYGRRFLCKTPCSIDGPSRQYRRLTLRKKGFYSRKVKLRFKKKSTLRFKMKRRRS